MTTFRRSASLVGLVDHVLPQWDDGSVGQYLVKADSQNYAWSNGPTGLDLVDFGGVSDGVTDDSAALVSAIASGDPVSITSATVATPTVAQAITILENLNLYNALAPLTITLPSGEIDLTTFIDYTNPFGGNVTVTSAQTTATTASAVSSSGSTKNWAVTYTVASAAGIATGDYIIVRSATGTGNPKAVEGCFKVTGVSGSDVTVKHTSAASSFPTVTLTTATVIPVKTILRWDSSVNRGLAVLGTSLKEVSNLVLAGNFNITSESPSDGAGDGLMVGSSANTLDTGLSESQQTNDGVLWISRVGIVEWDNNGVEVVGGKLYATASASCSNGWRGWQAARNGNINCKACSAVGNGSSGFETEGGGAMVANDAVAHGNIEQGFYAIEGVITAADSFAIANTLQGYYALNNATMSLDGSTATLNDKGLLCRSSSVVFGASATSSSNTTSDVEVDEGGFVNASGASSLGATISVENDSGALLIDTDGDLLLATTTKIGEGSGGNIFEVTVSSIGDVIFRPDQTSLWTMKANGDFYPNNDDAEQLGRNTNRMNRVYTNSVQLIDGVTAPGTISGHASLYVDTADGDLKIKFGDGTVKTIVTDT